LSAGLAPSLRGFRPAWLTNDLIAGAMLAAIAVPEQIATARLAGMPVQTGLYAFAAGSLAFALFGKNRFVSVGADSTIAPIFASAAALVVASGSSAYPALIGVLAIVAGVVLVATGFLKAGWIADLLSVPVTTGFLAGIAVHIVVGQLPLIVGVPSGSGSLVQHALALLRALPQANVPTLVIGCGVLGVTILADRLSPRVPGPLIGLVGATVATAAFRLHEHGVALLGALPAALPQLRFPAVDPGDALRIVPTALVVALVCMVQTAVVVRSFPADADEPDDPSNAFTAVGIGSIVAAFVGAFAVDASPPRTSIAASSGARSQLAGVIAVATVALVVVFASRYAADLPLAALGGVLVFVGARLFRASAMVRIARYGRGELWLVAAGALLVIALPIQTGMVLAIVLSLVHGISIIARPPSRELARIRGTTIWWPPSREPTDRVAGVFVFSPAAPITFTNVEYIVRAIRTGMAKAAPPVRLVVIEGSGVIDIDYTGAQSLRALIADLTKRGIVVALARLEDVRAQAAAQHTGILRELGTDRVFPSVQEAIDALFRSA
jgi:MFS superfamily sulfate permease-like transporter